MCEPNLNSLMRCPLTSHPCKNTQEGIQHWVVIVCCHIVVHLGELKHVRARPTRNQ